MIEITCPKCGKQFRKSDEDKHSIVHCPYCFASMTLNKKQQTHKSNNIVKKILSYIPGFRSKTVWKMIIAIIYYLISLLLSFAIGLDCLLFLWALPFIVMNIISAIRHKDKQYLLFAACAFIIAIASLVFIPGRSQKNNTAPTPRPTTAVAAHAPTVRPTTAPTIAATEAPASPASAADASHTELVKSLYNELVEKCSYYEASYNESEFNAFLTDWNARRNAAQEKLTSENADISLRMIIGDLNYLETELKNKVTGGDFDNDYIKMVADEIAELQ